MEFSHYNEYGVSDIAHSIINFDLISTSEVPCFFNAAHAPNLRRFLAMRSSTLPRLLQVVALTSAAFKILPFLP